MVNYKPTEKDNIIESVVKNLSRALNELGVKGIEYDHEQIIFRTKGYKVILNPKVHKDTLK